MSTSTPWGRVDDDGTVYVRTPDGERVVGSWQAGAPEAGLAHFVRRYDDLATEVTLLEQRLASGAADASATSARVKELRTTVPTANVVGDLAGLERRLAALEVTAGAKREEQKAARAEAAAKAADVKRALVAEAETIAQATQWKAGGDRLREIVESWRDIKGVDRKTDGELWKRLSAARSEFTRRRGAHFATLDEQRKEALARKEKIVVEAESLANSTDWAATGNRYKALMADWKAAGHAPREAEDGLWARFRGAQDTFFANRSQGYAAQDAELAGNQAKKEALLVEAEALDPQADFEGAQAKFRELQERWEAAGRAPREAAAGLEKRMQAVADRLRDVVDARWRQTNVSTSPVVIRLVESVEKLERKLARAREAGKGAEVADLEAKLATQKEWLAQAELSDR